MFVEDENGEKPFHNAIRCAAEALQDKIISSDSDLVGICFYGTVRFPGNISMEHRFWALTSGLPFLIQKHKQNINDLDGIYAWQELDVPDAEKILALEELLGIYRLSPP